MAGPTTPKSRIAFIDIGRAAGALLVFYSHIAEQWVAKRETGPTPVVDFLDAVGSDPMRMGFQGIGQIAVPFFFLVSGYVVTPIALRQGGWRFTVNRLIRVHVPMTFAVLLTAALVLLGVGTLAGASAQTVTWTTVLTNSLVVNYVLVPQVVLVGVAWTLVVELVFYALLVAVLPVLRRWTWAAIAGQLTFVFVVMMSMREFGPSWFLFAVNACYLPAPILGQVVWATTTGRVPLWLGMVFGSVAWGLYVLGDHLGIGRLDGSYPLALAVALLFFLLGMFAEPRLRERRVWTALSERSYSLYLLHGIVAWALLELLRPTVPLWLAVPVAVAATFGVVEVSYRFVERPSHALARRWSRPARTRWSFEEGLTREIEAIKEEVARPSDATVPIPRLETADTGTSQAPARDRVGGRLRPASGRDVLAEPAQRDERWLPPARDRAPADRDDDYLRRVPDRRDGVPGRTEDRHRPTRDRHDRHVPVRRGEVRSTQPDEDPMRRRGARTGEESDERGRRVRRPDGVPTRALPAGRDERD
ncbi:hypothetical protein GCM10022243_28460 [Saccharothrix violaceirubra]|uniref:Peptidoglycan/LPS O-acetylase OafA/YrhL n=1 Tax=Saccharothrix violaceirubra TaxID=413306 RepID=A0A7W7WZ63_9PSEU|nr:acyltransferase [Saccharothrix violaceirubra]MBB4969229.1 peptidoglycan/LPS O-acetylase OafA/YrhL [Saccharothrix violaceirubra]